MKTLTKTTEALYNTVLSDRQLSAIVGGAKKPLQSSLSIGFEQVKKFNDKSVLTYSKTIVDIGYSGSTKGLLGLAVIIANALGGNNN